MRVLSILNWLAVCFALFREGYAGLTTALVLGAIALCLYDSKTRPVRYPVHAIKTRTGFLILLPRPPGWSRIACSRVSGGR